MRRGDIGPFGVATLTFVVLIQVLALGEAVLHGLGTAGDRDRVRRRSAGGDLGVHPRASPPPGPTGSGRPSPAR